MYPLQEIIARLKTYWDKQGCNILEPVDMEVGAATFHPETFFRALDSESYRCAYVQASRRPRDGRYGLSPIRTGKHHQFQVLIKPPKEDFLDLYLGSLNTISISAENYDIKLLEDNWKSPSLGAWGLGWECRVNNTEISQITYFQQVGGKDCRPVTGEIAYGLERIAMLVQKVDSINDIAWSYHGLKYGDLFYFQEQELSKYNLDFKDEIEIDSLSIIEEKILFLLGQMMPLMAYDSLLKMNHVFNVLDARSKISLRERQHFILKIRSLAVKIASDYTSQYLGDKKK